MTDDLLFISRNDLILFLNKQAAERGYSGEYVAELMGKNDPTLVYQLRNLKKNPTFVTLEKYIDALDFKCSFVFLGKEYRNTQQVILAIREVFPSLGYTYAEIARDMGHHGTNYVRR